LQILLGLSGGVDSTASVLLLLEKGYKVTALYFDVLENPNIENRKRAEKAAEKLGIPFIYKNKAKDFEEKIIAYFCREYQNARTPSPCVLCNPLFKLKTLCDAADELNIPLIATGHYAKIIEKDGTYYVKKAANEKKDQSYMLCRVPQNILKRLVLPLSDIENKEEVRKLALNFGLENAKQKDSQDLCFMQGDYRAFLSEKNIKSKEGFVQYKDGKLLRYHDGIANFTIGQRKGLNIAVGKPAFVTDIDKKTGIVTMGDNEDLFKKEVKLEELFFFGKEQNDKDFYVKLRYSAKAAKAHLKNGILYFDEAQRAPTPGQFAVLYEEDILIASAVIV